MPVRPSIHQYLMRLAEAAATRSTCPRFAGGAVVSENGHVVATGYNGAPAKMLHCLEAGCLMLPVRERERCVRTIHAEANAIVRAGGRGDTIYTTGQPCYDCLKDLLNTNIRMVYYRHPYDDQWRDRLLMETHSIGFRQLAKDDL